MDTIQMKLEPGKDITEFRNLFLYSTGKIISVFGSAIYSFAMGLYILKLTGSALSFAITLILGVLPAIIINPFAGVIADKFDRKKLVVMMDLFSGILLVTVYFFCSNNEITRLLIYSTTFLLTVLTTFFGVGLEAAKPNIVSKNKLMNVNSISKIIDSVSSILGPMLGGVVYAFFDIRSFIIFNGISFICSGLAILFINFNLNESEPKQQGKIHFIRDINEGFQYLRKRRRLMGLISLLISVNFFLGYAVTIPLPYIINSVLHLDTNEFGIIQGALPVGMIFGAILIKKITESLPYTVLFRYISISLAILMTMVGIPVLLQNFQMGHLFYTSYYCTVMFFFGVTVALIDLPLAYIFQVEIPDEYRGRVLSIGISLGKTMLPVAMIISGVLLNFVPTYMLPISGGGLFLLFNLRALAKIRMTLSSE